MEKRVGKVEDFTFTSGGAGNQWTTIDGVRYATWWNTMTTDWRKGDVVTFDYYRAPLWSGGANVDCARNIRFVEAVDA